MYVCMYVCMYLWLSGLSWTLLYINNIQRMLNKYLTRFMLEFLEFMAIDKPKEGSAVRVRLPMMAAYKGKLRPKRVPFSGLRYM